MSYKHNNLMAMRHNYWNDCSEIVQSEKLLLKQLLIEQGIFQKVTLEDVQYFFFSLPSVVIIKAYAVGFHHHDVQRMVVDYIQSNRRALIERAPVKIQFNLP